MKNSNSAKKHPKLKKVLSRTGIFFALFGIAAVGTYYGIPQKGLPAKIDEEEGEFIPDTPTLPGAQRLINNLQSNLVGGLDLNIKEFKVELPASKEGNGTNTITNTADKGIDLKLQIGNLSSTDMKIVHSINLDLDANVSYNPVSGYSHERHIGLTLVDDEAYIGITSINPEESELADGTNWDFKYNASIKEYQSLEGIDPITGGKQIYEFGKLDYVIHTILDILTDGDYGYDIEIPSLYDLINKKEEAADTEESANESEETSGSSISFDDIMDALGDMVEEDDGTGKYFTLDLPLGDININVGLKTDAEYNLTGVDLPAKGASSSTWDIETGEGTDRRTAAKISLHADVSNIADTAENLIVAPADASSYKKIEDSMALWTEIAQLAKSPSLTLKTIHEEDDNVEDGLLITHYKRSKMHEDTPVYEAQETATIDLNGGVKFAGIKNFEGFGVNVSFKSEQEDEDGNPVLSQASLSANYDVRESEENKGAFVNINDTLKASMDKVTLDELIARIKDAINKNTEEEEETTEVVPVTTETSTEEEESMLKDLIKVVCENFKTANDIKEAVDGIMDSKFIKDVKQMTFGSALDLIKEISNDDNLIKIVVNLAYIGLPGEIVIKLDKTSESIGLASIKFDGVRFDAIQLDGTIVIDSYDPATDENKVFVADKSEYQQMTHILGVYDQVKDIAEKKAIGLGIDASIMNYDKDDNMTTGVKIDGAVKASWAENNGRGTGNITIDHIAENYSQKHNIAVDAVNKVNKDEEGNELSKEQYFKVQYDSNNGALTEEIDQGVSTGKFVREDGAYATNPTSNAIKAKMDVSSFKATFEEVKDLIKKEDFKDRTSFFGGVAWAIAEPSMNKLIEKVVDTTNEDDPNLFGLFKKQIIKEVNIGADQTDIKINKDLFGLKSDIELTLGFADGNGVKDIYGKDDRNKTAEEIAASQETETPVTPVGSYSTNGLSYIGVKIENASTKENKKLGVEAKITLEEIAEDETFAQISDENIKAIEGVDKLISYGANGLMLGTSETVKSTTFDFNLGASVKLFQHEIKLIDAGLKTRISPTSNQLHASMLLPAIKGLNAPDSDIYFRQLEEEGNHDVNMYFDAHKADGIHEANTEEGGEFYITRESDYGKVRDVTDDLTLSGKEFGEHPLEFLLQYMVGVDTRYFAEEEVADPEPAVTQETQAEEETSTGWSPYAKEALHLEDCDLHYDFVEGVENDNGIAKSTWNITVNLGKVLHLEGLLDRVNIGLEGIKGDTYKTISALNISAKARLGNSQNGNGVNLAEVKIGLGLNNVTEATGYDDNWTELDEAATCGFSAYKSYTFDDIKENDYNLYVGYGAYVL